MYVRLAYITPMTNIGDNRGAYDTDELTFASATSLEQLGMARTGMLTAILQGDLPGALDWYREYIRIAKEHGYPAAPPLPALANYIVLHHPTEPLGDDT